MEMWVNNFLVWAGLFSGFCIFIDFMLTKKQKQFLKVFSAKLSRATRRITYQHLLVVKVEKSFELLTNWFGVSPFSKRRIFGVATASLLVGTFVALLLNNDSSEFHTHGIHIFDVLPDIPPFSAILFFPLYLSLSLTIWLLGFFIRKSTFPRYLLVTLCDSLGLLIIGFLPFAILSISSGDTFLDMIQFLVSDPMPYWVPLMVVSMTAFPTAIHTGAVGWSITARVLGAILLPLLALLFKRIYQSKRGVISLVGTGIAFIVTVIEQYIKSTS